MREKINKMDDMSTMVTRTLYLIRSRRPFETLNCLKYKSTKLLTAITTCWRLQTYYHIKITIFKYNKMDDTITMVTHRNQPNCSLQHAAVRKRIIVHLLNLEKLGSYDARN